jgi:hypothetical protein
VVQTFAAHVSGARICTGAAFTRRTSRRPTSKGRNFAVPI